MNQKEHTIARVLPGSIAEELELEAGDVLLSVGGQRVQDIFDYRYLTNEEYLEICVRKADGEENWRLRRSLKKIWGLSLKTASWTITGPAGTSVSSALSISFPKECGIPCILRTTTPGSPFSRGIM